MNMHIFDKLKNEPIIAYLSMEIALSSDMPTYSGGWEFWLEIQFVLQPTSLLLCSCNSNKLQRLSESKIKP